MTPSSRAVLSSALLVALVAAACADDPARPDDDVGDISGLYRLTLVGDRPVPAVMSRSGSEVVTVEAGRVTLAADSRFATSLTLGLSGGDVNGTLTRTGTGTYERTDASIVLHFDDGDSDGGTVTGRTLRIIDEGLSFTYRRE